MPGFLETQDIMQIDTVQKSAADAVSTDATTNNVGIWEGYLSAGPADLAGSGTTSGSFSSSDKGKLTVNYDDKSFTYEAADGTLTKGTIDKTFSLASVGDTSLGGGTLAFTDGNGKLWILSQNAPVTNTRWTYYAASGGALLVVIPSATGGATQVAGTASSDLWYIEQKYAVQPPPVHIMKWTGYLSGGPTQLNGTRQSGALNDGPKGTLYVDYLNRSFTYIPDGEGPVTGKIVRTFPIQGGSGMSIGAGTLAFTDEKGQLWIFTQNQPGSGGHWTYIPAASTDALSLVTKSTTSSNNLQSGGYGSTDLWLDELKYGTPVPEVCYLPGTLIATPQGDKPVEALKPGDEVLVLREGVVVAEKIIWTGSGFCSTRNTRHKDLAGHPVRIHAGALGGNLPSEDLVVTSEHCLYLDGALIPARMLVNNHSITYEDTLSYYEYHHFELETHGLIFANGAVSESYLDTGNRVIFGLQVWAPDKTPSQRKVRSWAHDAAAPLQTSREFVEPVWLRLAAHANHIPAPEAWSLPEDDIFLEVQDGGKVRYLRKGSEGYVFMVEPKGQDIFLRTNTHRPCDRIGPFVDDRRELGLLVGGIKVFTSKTSFDIDPNSITGAQNGWHGIESPTQRWTRDKALIPLREAENDEPLVIFVSAAPNGARQASKSYTH